MFEGMRKYWWLVLLRGIAALLFGVFTLFMPGVTAVSLVLAFGLFAIVSGGASLGIALFGEGRSSDRVLLGLSGVLSAILGVLVLTWPGISMIWLLLTIIAYAFVNGIVEIVAAFQVRDVWLGLSGLVSMLFGLYAFRFPADGALALIYGIGLYAVAIGVMLIVSSFQVRKLGQTFSPNVPAPQH